MYLNYKLLRKSDYKSPFIQKFSNTTKSEVKGNIQAQTIEQPEKYDDEIITYKNL